MAHNIDLTIPSTAPVERFLDEPEDLRPAALYTLVDLSDAELQELQRVCESESVDPEPGRDVKLAPRPRYLDGRLRSVYDSHLELIQHGQFEPFYFIVAISKDWRQNGVLLVGLHDDDLNCTTDYFRVKASETGLIIANLQISNTEWEDNKEFSALETYNDDDGGSSEQDSDDEDDGDGSDDEGDSSDSGPDFPQEKPEYDAYTPIYTLELLDADKLIETLEPGIRFKKDPFRQFFIRAQGSLRPEDSSIDPSGLNTIKPSITQDLVAQACSLHPVRCRKNPYLHKSLLLVCDTTNPKEHGLILVQLSWDQKVKESQERRSKSELREIGANSARKTRRIECSVDGIQDYFCGISTGVRVWKAEHPIIIVFQYNTGKPESEQGARLLDPQHSRRKKGDRYLEYAPRWIQEESQFPSVEVKWSLEEAVRRFPWICRSHRFEDTFLRDYFICVDNKNLEKTGVLVVRVDWDQNISRSEQDLLSLDLKNSIETLRLPIKEALSIIEKGKGGSSADLTSEQAKFFQLG